MHVKHTCLKLYKGGYKLGLNPEQQRAVETIEGPLQILAGAGSGKTTVLMNRIAAMINQGINPWNILAVTFTNKASNEMIERIGSYTSPDMASKLHMSTFHSFCLNILKREWKHLEMFEKGFDVSDPGNASAYLRGILKNKTKTKPNTILGYISSLKNEMVDGEAFQKGKSTNPHIDWNKVSEIIKEIQDSNAEHYEILKWAFPAYDKIMKEKDMVDFDDLILLVIKLFILHPDILEKYQEKFKYIMVDEYQDTNRAQYILMKLLAAKYKNIAVVGDDYQSIYKFRGSDIRNILNFDEDYPNAKVIKLEQNYRSTKRIIDASNQVISRNKKQKHKLLFTDNPLGEKITVFNSDYAEDGAEYIAQTIEELMKTEDFNSYNDFTVLYRNNSLSADAEIALRNYNIPFVKLSGRGFFETEEIQDIIKYLEFIHNPNNLDAFAKSIRKPKRRIAEKTIKKIETEFFGGNLLEILDDLSYIERVQKKAIEEGQEFASIIRKYQAIKDTVSVSHIIKGLLKDIQYEEKVLSAYDTEQKETKLQNIDKMIEMILTKETKTEQIVLLSDYVEEIMLFNAEETDTSNAVKLMTIHGSKGLEFPVVFVLGMNDGIFPSIRFSNNKEFIYDYQTRMKIEEKRIADEEEERRMCYVAFTRAKKRLFLTHASYRIRKADNKKSSLNPSRFLNEFSHDLKDYL